MRSSYKDNLYGNVFRALILGHKPRICVECGVLDGYSLFHIAQAVRFNMINGDCFGYVDAYDLWDQYDYNHGDHKEVKKMIDDNILSDFVSIMMGDAFEVYQKYMDGGVDFLHVDISNNGDILLKILDLWGNKLSDRGIIAFEGGSEERDNIEWMKKYKYKPIRKTLMMEEKVYKNWRFQIFEDFPSLTLLWKKKKFVDGR